MRLFGQGRNPWSAVSTAEGTTPQRGAVCVSWTKLEHAAWERRHRLLASAGTPSLHPEDAKVVTTRVGDVRQRCCPPRHRPAQLTSSFHSSQSVSLLRCALAVIGFQLVEGSRVATRVTVSGTHRGPYTKQPASHKRVAFAAHSSRAFKDGKLTDYWLQGDLLGL
jgi:SnoaL-like polyketide cyclase